MDDDPRRHEAWPMGQVFAILAVVGVGLWGVALWIAGQLLTR